MATHPNHTDNQTPTEQAPLPFADEVGVTLFPKTAGGRGLPVAPVPPLETVTATRSGDAQVQVEGVVSAGGKMFLSRNNSLYLGEDALTAAEADVNISPEPDTTVTMPDTHGNNVLTKVKHNPIGPAIDNDELRRHAAASIDRHLAGVRDGFEFEVESLRDELQESGGDAEVIADAVQVFQNGVAEVSGRFQHSAGLEDLPKLLDEISRAAAADESANRDAAIAASVGEINGVLENYVQNQLRPMIERKVDQYADTVSTVSTSSPTDCREAAENFSNRILSDEGSRPILRGDGQALASGDVLKVHTDLKDTEFQMHFVTVVARDGHALATIENTATKASDGFSKPETDPFAQVGLYESVDAVVEEHLPDFTSAPSVTPFAPPPERERG